MSQFIILMFTFYFSFLLAPFIITDDDSGGELIPQQAAYDVKYYKLDLSIDPDGETIEGSVLMKIEIINNLDSPRGTY